MKVLFYYPSNKKTVAFNSIIRELSERGYEMFLLTTCSEGVFHEDCKKMGVKVFSNYINTKNPFIYYFKQIIFLIRFCRKNKIEVVLSNLQHVNFISVWAQYFVKSKIIIYRHHFNYINLLKNGEAAEMEKNKNELIFDRIINRLAKKIVVPSNSVKDGMVKCEGANAKKIVVMQYLYDFSMYNKPNLSVAENLSAKYKTNLLLLMCARLIKLKGHLMVFKIVKELVKEENMDIKMIVLDDGPEKEELEKYILENQLGNHIFMLGYSDDIVSVMASSDLMIHPSLTEASNSAVKEMALLGKTCVVCDGVGDFSDYFENNKNGFLINPNTMNVEIKEIIVKVYEDKLRLKEMGNRLKETVSNRFGVTEVNVDKFINSFEN